MHVQSYKMPEIIKNAASFFCIFEDKTSKNGIGNE
jgi:hypothetical protein